MAPATSKKRRCSVCRKTGHTKRTCREKIGQLNTHIFVRTHGEKDHSPHVIDLKGSKKRALPDVPLFREPKKHKIVRQTIDFASHVRSHYKKIAFTADKIVPKKKQKKTKTLPQVTPRVKKVKKQRAPRFQFKFLPDTLPWRHLAIASVALFVIAAVPFPAISYYRQAQQTGNQIVDASTHGFVSLQSSTLDVLRADTAGAQAHLAGALAAFDEATSLIEEKHQALQFVAELLPIIGPELKARQSLLQAGQHIALGNTYLIKGISESAESSLAGTERLHILRDHMRASRPQYDQALVALSEISASTIPSNYQQAFQEFQILFASFVDDIDDMAALIDALAHVLGEDDFRRYMVVFQNEGELRATGGFLGSFAICDFQKGSFLGCDIPEGGSYDLKGQLASYVKPPVPLQLVNGRWEFQDANWWPDFETSAQKMMWFYEESRDTTLDGVIAVNSAMLERFLSIVGPITNSAYGVTLDSDTAVHTLQHKVEIDYDKEANTPKAIIGDLAQQFLTLVPELSAIDTIRLVTGLHQGAETKDIQVYFSHPSTQQTFTDFGWTGTLLPVQAGQDYLMVVGTNIQGQKSDAKVTQHIEHQAHIQDDGRIIVTTAIRRTHTGRVGEQFYGGPNISYVRAYVPQGALLQEAAGFEFPPEEAFHVPEDWYADDADLARIEKKEQVHLDSGTRVTQQFDKTVFGNWMITLPGEERVAYFTYELPFGIPLNTQISQTAGWTGKLLPAQIKEASRYTLLVQAQSGAQSTFSSSMIYPDGWAPAWRSSDDIVLAENGATVQQESMHDMIYGIVMEQSHTH